MSGQKHGENTSFQRVTDRSIPEQRQTKDYGRCIEYQNELVKKRYRNISRRNFIKISTVAASSYGLASIIGSMGLNTWAEETKKGEGKEADGIKVNKARCTGCGQCESICPEGAITAWGIAKWNDDLCIRCLECYRHCPNEALEVIYE